MMKEIVKPVTIIGAGLAGSLMAILLGRRGIPINLIERRADVRKHSLHAGRSINLALADRGLHALKAAGIYDAVQSLLIPMSGRMLHDIQGRTQFVPYGQREHEVIHSVSRDGLTKFLLDYAEQHPDVSMQFDAECTRIESAQRQLTLAQHGITKAHGYDQLIAADGYHSVVREYFISENIASASNDLLPHGYKELTLPADVNGHHQLHTNALHIWPRGGFMLIALPNFDGSFTVTLFLPFESDDPTLPCFAKLHDANEVTALFTKHFSDALALMPNLAEEFFSHPTGRMHTVRTSQWTDGNGIVLIGDAAHAIVPFHGQGMNCAFEDCIVLDQLMQQYPASQAFKEFTRQRKRDTDAIAEMALENYVEMRNTVRQPKFALQKELSFELERRFPQQFIPRYSMVMFHHDIPYSLAFERGKIQAQILDELTQSATCLEAVDMQLVAQKIQAQLPSLDKH